MTRLTWRDMSGRKHYLHKVRVVDHDGWGNPVFGVMNVYRNIIINHGFHTREEAWEALKQIEEEAA